MTVKMLIRNESGSIGLEVDKKVLFLSITFLLLVSNILVFVTSDLFINFFSVIVLFYFLPGFMFCLIFLNFDNAKYAVFDIIVLSLGIGVVISTFYLYFFNFLPIIFTKVNLIISISIFNFLIALVVFTRFEGFLKIENDLKVYEFLLFCIIFLITIYFSFFHLGYSEFIADEAEVAIFSKDLITGNSNAIFSYVKGPTQSLVPIPFVLIYGYWTELALRVPFAFAGIVDVFLVYLLAKRMFNRMVGLYSSLLYSAIGFNIAFSRTAQYQTILILTMLIAMLFFYEALKLKEIDSNINKEAGYFFLLGSFFFAFGLFTHYDMLFFSFPVIFIWYKIFGLKSFYKDEIFYKALLIFLFFTWIFYVPFVLNPGFNDAVNHYLERRVGVGAPPGLNLEWWLIQTSLYCSSYLVFFLLISSFSNLLRKKLSLEFVLLLIWFFSYFIPLTLILKRPGSHYYTLMPAWTILAILGLRKLYEILKRNEILTKKNIRIIQLNLDILELLILILLTLGLISTIYYSHMVYIDHETLYVYSYPEHKNDFYFNLRPIDEIGWKFGFPYKVGWKVIGSLFKTQQLEGSYFTNEDPRIPDFYIDQQPSEADIRYYIIVKYVWNEQDLNKSYIETTYDLISIVYVNNNPTISIYETNSPIDDNHIRYDLKDYERDYDLKYREI